jgi:putative membrane protein (TIGR04086 family)
MKRGLLQWGKVLGAMVAVTAILLLLLSLIFYKMNLSDRGIAVGIVVIYLAANFVGGFIMGKIKEENKYKWGALVGIMFFVALSIISMVVTGELYSSGTKALWALLSCVGGGMIGGMCA